jgi:hypothetical protein
MKITKAASLMAILFLPVIWGCNEDPAAPEGRQEGAPASTFTADPYLYITPGLMILGPGEEGQFSAQLFPYHATAPTPENLHWTSMDPADGFMDQAWVRIH